MKNTANFVRAAFTISAGTGPINRRAWMIGVSTSMKCVNRLFIVLIILVTVIFSKRVDAQSTSESKVTAHDSLRSIVVENPKTHERVSLTVGQTVRYKLRSSPGYSKDRMTGITDSTISFQNRYKLIVTSSSGKAVTIVPGTLATVTLKTGVRIVKMQVLKLSQNTIEGESGNITRKIAITDILNIEKWDSAASGPDNGVSTIAIEPLPVKHRDIVAFKIRRSKERRAAGTVLTILGGLGTFVGLVSAASPPSGSDPSGVGSGLHIGGLIIGAVSLPLLGIGIALKSDKKIDLEKSWKLGTKSLTTASAVVPVQQYEKFKAGLGFGYAASPGDASSGTLVTLEPAYRASSSLAFGLRLDIPSLASNVPVFVSPTYCYPGPCPAVTTPSDFRGAPGVSVTTNGQYYFSTGKFTPFVGAGLGLFTFSYAGTQFGFYPRVGFDVSHFSMSVDYNYVPSVRYDYLGLRLGFFVGGGLKQASQK